MSAISSHQLEILGLGMSMMDSILMVDAFPEISGVTEVVESVMMGGGPVPTALCAASRLGAKAGIIDRIGLDWAGELIRDDYRDYGVSTQHLQLEQGCRSSFGTVLVRRSDGERHIVFRAGDFTPLAKEELPVEALEHCSILHLNGRHWPACIDASRLVREKGGRVSFDGGAHRFNEKFLRLLPLVDILVVASDFAAKLSGSIERDAQLEALAQWNASVVGTPMENQVAGFLIKKGTIFTSLLIPSIPWLILRAAEMFSTGRFYLPQIAGILGKNAPASRVLLLRAMLRRLGDVVISRRFLKWNATLPSKRL
jgi:sugar/nucleoside kinase (ribokinase family)